MKMSNKKPKRMKSNTFQIDTVKPRNAALHIARHSAKAGKQSEKVDFDRQRIKRDTREALFEG